MVDHLLFPCENMSNQPKLFAELFIHCRYNNTGLRGAKLDQSHMYGLIAPVTGPRKGSL